MKTIVMVGSRGKHVMAMYMAETMRLNGYKTLIVDGTSDKSYSDSFIPVGEARESFYEVAGIDVVSSSDISDVVRILKNQGLPIESYDIVLVDTNDIVSMLSDWGDVYEYVYVSDNDMASINKDVRILNRFLDDINQPIRRINYGSNYKANSKLILLAMNERIQFSPFSKEVDYDEDDSYLYHMIQYQGKMALKKLPRDRRDMIKEVVSDWVDIQGREYLAALNKKLFGRKAKSIEVEEAMKLESPKYTIDDLNKDLYKESDDSKTDEDDLKVIEVKDNYVLKEENNEKK